MSRRTTVTLDDAVLSEAQAALGTTGVQDTVDQALAEAVRRRRLQDLAERMQAGTAFAFGAADRIDRDAQWRTCP